jgi:sugar phosphate isomerase/epimerase
MPACRVAVSTWSLHGELGPLRLTQRRPDGRRGPWVRELPHTLDLLDFPAQAKRRLGVDRVEICQMHLPSRDDAYLEELSGALRRAGSTLVCMPIDVGNISAADPAYREDDLHETEAWIDAAARLGAPAVRVNTNGPPPMAHEPIGTLEETAASLRRLLRYGAERGVAVLIENHGGITADPEAIARLVEMVGHDLKTIVDVGNFEPALSHQRHDADFAGLDFEPLYRAIARVMPHAALVHAKSVRFGPDGRHAGWDLHRALGIAREAGFRGDVSIEYGGRVDPWENALRTRRVIEEVFG